MVWARLEDGFPTHPKVLALSDAAFRAHVTGICYSAQHLTDGYVPPRLIDPGNAEELIEAGLWDHDGNGFRIHDFLDYNPSREDVLEKRQASIFAGKKGAQVRWGRDSTRHSERHSSGDSEGHGEPYGEPVSSLNSPDPTRPDPRSANGKSADALAEILLASDSTAQYLLSRLSEEWQSQITPAALVKLGREYGASVVVDALRNMREEDAGPQRPFPYLESVCKRLAAGVTA